MSKLLVVTGPLYRCGSSRRLIEFASALPAGAVDLCVLGQATPWSDSLARQGISVTTLGGRPFDPRVLWRLRQRIHASGADAVCAWGVGAAWPAVLAGVHPGRLGVVAPLPREVRPSLPLGWLLRRAGVVVADGASEADQFRRLGVSERRLRVVPPGLEVPLDSAGPGVRATCTGLPDDAQVLLVAGPLRRCKGQRDGVWALDILGFLHERLHLVVVGSGPDEPGVRRFVEVTQREDRAHFVGEVADVAPWLARADAVLIGGRVGGRTLMLEAMAAGRPVVAMRTAGREELLTHDRTGLFAAAGDVPDLCRHVQTLLQDPQKGAILGMAARDEVRQRFAAAVMAQKMQQALLFR